HRYYAQTAYRTATYHHSRYDAHYDIDRSQQSVDAYNYVSSSRVTRSGYSQSSYESSGYEDGGYQSGGRVTWVDGYGRGHFNNGPVTVAAPIRGSRLARNQA